MTNVMQLVPLANTLKTVAPSIRLEVNGLKLPKRPGGAGLPVDNHEGFDCCLPGFDPKYQGQDILRKQRSERLYLLKMRFPWLFQARRFGEIEASIDIIHLHGLFMYPIHYYLAKYSSKPFVVSCWGSDVLREADMAKVEVQQQILRRASAITVTGPEFKEIILSKYGRDLAPKIHNTFFDPALGDLPVLDRISKSDELRSQWGVRPDQLILCLAHNGFKQNQHLELLHSLSSMPEELKKRIYIIAPMTYGGNLTYQDEVSLAMKAAGISGRLICDFMTDEELYRLRLATDILLYAPISDAFSASVSQALAAGSVAILGSWLPYKARIRAGFRYHEIDATSDAAACLQSILLDWENVQLTTKNNRPLSAEFFSQARMGQQWIQAYEAAIQNHEKTQKEKLMNE